MPNNYTYGIHEGKPGADNARAYLWQCVRAFGVCMMQREEGLDEAIKYPEPPTYHLNALAVSEQELEVVLTRTEVEWHSLYDTAMDDARTQANKSRNENAAVTARYNKVQAEIEAIDFDPVFDNLRKTALEWIEQSRPSDTCYYESQIMTFEVWKTEMIRHANWAADYHKRKHEKAMIGYAEQITYLQKLIDLLGEPPQGLK